eukprot:TRINITY_DN4390_c0_g1_i1.p1 TRINITY_DN4390_c0_g1~~TRINITY_DN4390_c0_g1_i1.p1  ORF type:complete len:236 (-),score=51.27 TRINITY_DN4390_c0_g1_i1:182-889(-)
MMRMRNMKKGENARGSGSGLSEEGKNGPDEVGWELRPGGMVVQTRDPSLVEQEAASCPKITLRVTYGSSMHYVSISKRATFGQLKKMLASETGLDPQDQKVFFKGKERDAKEFLDLVGVKERSKILLVEDPLSQEKRFIEMRKNAKAEKASRAIADVGLQVDRLAAQVSALEGLINKGKRVAENDLVELTEHLMRHLVTLDGLQADGDAKMQKRIQVNNFESLTNSSLSADFLNK